jgi:hypothetical protein
MVSEHRVLFEAALACSCACVGCGSNRATGGGGGVALGVSGGVSKVALLAAVELLVRRLDATLDLLALDFETL